MGDRRGGMPGHGAVDGQADMGEVSAEADASPMLARQ